MINNKQKIYSYIGLAMRAGQVVSGDDTTLKELKKGKLSFGKQNLEAGTIREVLKIGLPSFLADDASENTKKLFKDKSSYRKINQIYFSTKVELGLAIGKSPRAVIGIKDKSLASKITELMQ